MRKRGSIVAKLMAQSLSKAGFDHIITLDLHQKEVQGYFDCPVENLRHLGSKNSTISIDPLLYQTFENMVIFRSGNLYSLSTQETRIIRKVFIFNFFIKKSRNRQCKN